MHSLNSLLPICLLLIIIIILFFFVHTSISQNLQRSTYIIHMDKSLMPNIFTNHHHWYISTLDSITSNGPKSTSYSSPTILYTYDNVLHGFSALLSPSELQMLQNHPAFITSYEDKKGTLDTTRTIDFLSLSPYRGLWPASRYGGDVIIGVIDTGVWPESRSFSDQGMTPVPSRWKGACESGQNFNVSLCNKKLIGARYFYKGVIAANPKAKVSMASARDIDGHGTHTSSTAAGNYVDEVSFFGYAQGTARGVAPHARVAMYKVVWNDNSFSSDIIAAFEQAISDGVDVISISLGFDHVPLHEDPVAIGSFAAMERGVFVSTSAGNSGPRLGSLHNGIPWVLTVAASTVDRQFSGTLTLGNGQKIKGWTLFPASAIIQKRQLWYNKHLAACNSSSEINKQVPFGAILVCDNTIYTSYQMSTLSYSKISAAIFISDDPIDYEVGGVSWPGIIIGSAHGREVINYASSGHGPWASMEFQETFVGSRPAPAAAFYTARGPARSCPRVLKPDVMAPGSQILAAYVPTANAAWIGSGISLSSEYALLSGTSMACPHASGVGALLRGAHPGWSPAVVRSAMMTTANPLDNTDHPIRDNNDLRGTLLSTPLAMGSGQVDPNLALNPGLVYDAGVQDYINLLCSMKFTKKQMLSIIRSNNYTCSSPSSDLNYPSFIALYDNKTTSVRVQTYRRTLTNVGGGAATYRAVVAAPKGAKVVVTPPRLVFRKENGKQSFKMRMKYKGDKKSEVTFGWLVWKEVNGPHIVRSPIVVSPLVDTN